MSPLKFIPQNRPPQNEEEYLEDDILAEMDLELADRFGELPIENRYDEDFEDLPIADFIPEDLWAVLDLHQNNDDNDDDDQNVEWIPEEDEEEEEEDQWAVPDQDQNMDWLPEEEDQWAVPEQDQNMDWLPEEEEDQWAVPVQDQNMVWLPEEEDQWAVPDQDPHPFPNNNYNINLPIEEQISRQA